MKLQLSNGMDYGIGANGEKICRGAQMGRPNILPQDIKAAIKLQMVRLKWIDGDFDAGGAYFGGGRGDFIYCAYAAGVQIFVRSANRNDAKAEIRAFLPNARFFN